MVVQSMGTCAYLSKDMPKPSKVRESNIHYCLAVLARKAHASHRGRVRGQQVIHTRCGLLLSSPLFTLKGVFLLVLTHFSHAVRSDGS